jgi:TonB family protein
MKSRFAVICFGFALLTPFVSAQTTEAGVSDRLKDKPLLLRGFWEGNKLEFDPAGQPKHNYPVASFTLSGFEFRKAKMNGNHLRLEGNRIGLFFDPQGSFKRIDLKQKIEIDIDANSSQNYTGALDAIFADSLSQIAATLPPIWQKFAQHLANASAPRPPSMQELSAARKEEGDSGSQRSSVGAPVRPPKLLKMADPEFSEEARRSKISGDVRLYLQVDENGLPSHVSISRPAGMGLDEKAVEAVEQYKFAPATKNGKPVSVELYIDVNFRIF